MGHRGLRPVRTGLLPVMTLGLLLLLALMPIPSAAQRGRPAEVPRLVAQLRDRHYQVRQNAAVALERLGPSAVPAVPRITQLLKNKGPGVRSSAAEALGRIGPYAVQAMPDLTEALKDTDREVRSTAAYALGRLGPPAGAAVRALTKALEDADGGVRSAAAYALGQIGRPAVVAVPVLTKSLKDTDKNVRCSAATALGQIGSSAVAAVPALINALKDNDDNVRLCAATALKGLGPAAAAAVPALTAALNDTGSHLRLLAADALGQIGSFAAAAAPALAKVLKREDPDMSPYAVSALGKITSALTNDPGVLKGERLPAAIVALSQAETALTSVLADKTRDADTIRQVRGEVRGALAMLQAEASRRFWNRIPAWMKDNPGWTALVAVPVLIWIVSGLLLWLRPLWLLRFGEFLVLLNALPESAKWIKEVPRYLLGAVFFQFHPRVLNAWVDKYAATVAQNLAKRPTFSHRSIYVDTPVRFPDGEKRPTPAAFHAAFDAKSVMVRLLGDGGSGKTTLACQIANWALGTRPTERVCRMHQTLPVFLEANLPGAKAGDSKPLLDWIRGEIRQLTGEEEAPPEDLIRSLLRKRRILLIVDGFSELDEPTRASIRRDDPALSLNALLVTSRADDTLNDGSGFTVRAGLLAGAGIADFIYEYIKRAGKANLLDDETFYNDLQHFPTLVGNREITALLAALYAQSMIERRENPETERPRNIPELMDAYVAEMCRKASDSTHPLRTVYPLACKIAWACIKDSLTPTEMPLAAVKAALKDITDDIELPTGQPDPEKVIEFYVERLRLLKWAGAQKQNLKFTLDPLSEYLAARYLVKYGWRDNSDRWHSLIEQLPKTEERAQSIAGFLRALDDVCDKKGSEGPTLDFVLPELRRRYPGILQPDGANQPADTLGAEQGPEGKPVA